MYPSTVPPNKYSNYVSKYIYSYSPQHWQQVKNNTFYCVHVLRFAKVLLNLGMRGSLDVQKQKKMKNVPNFVQYQPKLQLNMLCTNVRKIAEQCHYFPRDLDLYHI